MNTLYAVWDYFTKEIMTPDQVNNYMNYVGCKESCTIRAVQNAVEGVNKHQLWEWFRTYEPPADKGFMLDSHPNVEIMAKETEKEGHSGASFAMTLRYIQTMARDRLEKPQMFE
jgi:hypothetical protein